MFSVEFIGWFFEATLEDGMLPTLVGVLIEATLAALVPIVVYRVTDVRDIKDAINDLSLRVGELEEWREGEEE